MIKILNYGEVPNEELFRRGVSAADVSGAVASILADVRQNGDRALLEYTEKYDGVKLDSFAVSDEEMNEALTAV